jgi:carbon-monoxide dehydrogenase large subunit
MSTSIFGRVVLRTEDPRFLSGGARYVDDVPVEGALRATFIRSMMAHARVSGVDVGGARTFPGIAAVLTAGDLDLAPRPPAGNVEGPFTRPLLARDAVRFVGEPIAVVLADSLAMGQDAAEAVLVEYEPLGAVVGPEGAVAEGAALLFPEAGTNVAHAFEESWDEDVLAEADVVARLRVRHQRLAPVPMETNAILVVPEGEGLTVWVSTQIPFDVRADLEDWFGLEREAIHVIAPDVGGGFGAKLHVYPEYLVCAAAALRLGRPVKWVETRTESMTNLNHGRAQVHDVELGATRDGRLVGLRVDILADMGAYPIGAYLPPTTRTMLPGAYRVPRVASRGRSVVTSATPVAEYRGAGRPEAALSIERAMDALAAELGLDPVELRRRNLIPPEDFPFESAVGSSYDSGEYGRALDEALRIVGYEELRREQAARRARGDRVALGIGVCCYVEVTGFGRKEFGAVEVGADGIVTVRVGTTSTGQGHETAFAQLAASALGVPIERVRVLQSDTALVARGEGSYGSRTLQVGGTAVHEATASVLQKARQIAAHLLEVALEDVGMLDGGKIGVVGAPEGALGWAELAEAATDPAHLPEGLSPGLAAESRAFLREYTYPFGTHIAVVEVDLDTGDARLLRHVSVDDCGRVMNPMLVRGQIHGGLGQGIAQALYEGVEFDASGTPLTSTLATYPTPAATELPGFESSSTVTPTQVNPLGVKGVGESATIGSTPAVLNAVVDALSFLGVRHLDLPLTPERVWRAARETHPSA